MNPLTLQRSALLCLSLLVLPCSAMAEEAAATQAEAATHAEATAEHAAEATDDGVALGFAPPPVASKADISYSIGYKISSDMSKQGVEIDIEELIAGIRSGLSGDEPRLNDEQVEQCLFSLQMQMQEKHFAKAKTNLENGMAYLDANAKKEGVTVTESGLQYKVIESGDGPMPTVNDTVAARYHGTLIDGTVFDSSGEEPVPFPVGRVIPGWVEALQLMKVGDKWELTIPSELAYGQRGTPSGDIGPNEVLLFEIELVEIK